MEQKVTEAGIAADLRSRRELRGNDARPPMTVGSLQGVTGAARRGRRRALSRGRSGDGEATSDNEGGVRNASGDDDGSLHSAGNGIPLPETGPAVLQDILLGDLDGTDTSYQFRFSSDSKSIQAGLASAGQLDPIKVMAGEEAYVILDGFQRVSAAKSLGWKTVKALIYPWMPPEQARKVAFVSNVVRHNLTIAERANAMHLARREGYSVPELAKMFELSCRQVERHLELPAQLLEVIDGREVTMAHGKVLKDVVDKIPAGELQDLVARIRAEKLGVMETRKLLRTNGVPEKRGRTRVYGTIKESSVRVYDLKLGASSSVDELQAAALFLREAAARLDLLRTGSRSIQSGN